MTLHPIFAEWGARTFKLVQKEVQRGCETFKGVREKNSRKSEVPANPLKNSWIRPCYTLKLLSAGLECNVNNDYWIKVDKCYKHVVYTTCTVIYSAILLFGFKSGFYMHLYHAPLPVSLPQILPHSLLATILTYLSKTKCYHGKDKTEYAIFFFWEYKCNAIRKQWLQWASAITEAFKKNNGK